MHPYRKAALGAYIALIALVLGWEAWFAPPTPVARGFWVGLKLLPLLLPLPGLARGSARIHVLAAILVLLYFCEGVASGYDGWRSGHTGMLLYAIGEIGLTVLFIAAASLYARVSFRRAPTPVGTES